MGKPSPTAVKGSVDLQDWNFETDGNLKLDGEWEFYPFQFLDSNTVRNAKPEYVMIPSIWNDYVTEKGQKMTGSGYATYRLIVHTKPGHKHLGLRTKEQATSYRILINGKEYVHRGNVADKPEEFQPKTLPATVFFESDDSQIEIIVQIANFAHKSGGVWHSYYLGSKEDISRFAGFIKETEVFLLGTLFIMTLYHIGLYILRRKDKSTLFFALVCLTMFLRVSTTGEKTLEEHLTFLSYGFLSRLEYVTMLLLIPFSFHFFQNIFPEETHKNSIKIHWWISSACILITMLTPVHIFNYLVIPYQVVLLAGVIQGFIILLMAMFHKKEGANVVLLGYVAIVIAVINDVLYQNEIIRTGFIAPFGMGFMILSQSFMLSMKISRAFSEVEKLSESLKETNIAYSRFVPNEFLKFLEKNSIIDIQLGDQTLKRMSILFSDIRSFTNLSEKMSPKENFNFLNSYLKRMGPIILRHDGFIDKYIGDGIMALFPHGPESALDAAIEMQKEINIYNRHRMNSGYPSIKVGMGIHTGNMMLGIIGANERMEGTVISDAVNLASRIEGLTKIYGASILISGTTMEVVEKNSKYKYRVLDKVRVKGKEESITVFEIFNGLSENFIELLSHTVRDFERGTDFYHKGEFRTAREFFRKVLDSNPNDMAAKLYIQRCENALLYGVQENWDGVDQIA